MSVKDIDKLIKDLESNLSINKDNVEKLCDSLSCLVKTKNIDRNNTSNKRILVSKKKGKKFIVFEKLLLFILIKRKKKVF